MSSPKAWRAELGFTVEQMAAHVGVRRSTWNAYELGRRVPSLDIIVKVEALSNGQVTVSDWHALSLALPKIPPGRRYGTRLPSRIAHAAAA